jgi:lipoprotein-anchoring transpeptidase ErfK/SrfK
MPDITRRALLGNALALGAVAAAGGCTTATPVAQLTPPPPPAPPPGPLPAGVTPTLALMYGPVYGEPFPIPAIDLTKINPAFLRAEVTYMTPEPPGTIVIDPYSHYLYHVGEWGRAMRYGVGVGKQGFEWNGEATINSKQEWPDWYPPKEMIERRPDLLPQLTELQSGIGVPGGPRNPLGARAMYLWQNGKDTLYRIHGTVEPWTIGTSVSSGCIRMINQDAIDLYNRTPVGTRVVVLTSSGSPTVG